MNILVTSDGVLRLGDRRFRCALGKAGMIAAADKREGDNKTPLGTYPLRQVFYRPDRVDTPQTVLPCRALTPDDGWCDASKDPKYNQFVRHPYRASAERLWRDDDIYDLIVVLGHNDNPVVPGLGSAIFLHIAREGYTGTEGCVALAKPDLLTVLAAVSPASQIEIKPKV